MTYVHNAADAPSEAHVMRRNAEIKWSEFAPEAYWRKNYRSLRSDDRQIIGIVADFFDSTLPAHAKGTLLGIDIGSGANLYPALSLLPWCDRIALTDSSRANVKWLREELRSPDLSRSRWRPFWAEFARRRAYRNVDDPWNRLTEVTDVVRADVLYIPRQAWDVGTMFFVAESMSSYYSEFESAVRNFIRCLVPGAPFAAAFMERSRGYTVDNRSYPAVYDVDRTTVDGVLAAIGAEAVIHHIEVPATAPLRSGYDGMLVAVGRTQGS